MGYYGVVRYISVCFGILWDIMECCGASWDVRQSEGVLFRETLREAAAWPRFSETMPSRNARVI